MNLFTIKNVRFKDSISYNHILIKEGITTFICGKSGSGKSVLLKLLNASITAESGEILYQEKPIMEYDTIALRREVTLVSQNVFLFDDTIRNNFARFYSYREEKLLEDTEISKYLRLCMANFPLDVNCRELSGGERQRVFIAICLSFMPKVLMLDEPTSALDQATSNTLMSNLKEHCLKHGMTMIAITHDKALAQQYADAIVDLDMGV